MEKKTIIARAKVLEGKADLFLKAAEDLIQGTRAESGNISYTLYRNTETATDFLFYEEYESPEAMTVHAASAHFNSFVQAIDGMLAEDMIIESF